MSSQNVERLKFDASTHFEFGENWKSFAHGLTLEDADRAADALEKLTGKGEIAGKTFLDIGCGSGLHSLAALRLGARYVYGVDIDEVSVRTADSVARNFYHGRNYKFESKNILDGIADGGELFDIVYSWGVLHHTGAMWEAIEKTLDLVSDRGIVVLALYRKTKLCPFWTAEKRMYAKLGRFSRMAVTVLYASVTVVNLLRRGINPVTHIRNYSELRGMSWWYDRIDWLGGYPYESASPAEVTRFVERRGFRLVQSFNTDRAEPKLGLFTSGCAEYVFKRT